MKKPIIQKAFECATLWHAGQFRKKSNLPYIFHPVEVAQIVWDATESEEATAAALLHDTVEDCGIELSVIRDIFGHAVSSLVYQVTKVSCHADGVRAIRKEMDRVHYTSGEYLAQTIKLADCISNMSDINTQPVGFIRIYIPELKRLVDTLHLGDKGLQERAKAIISEAYDRYDLN